jgi:hypothetical protein
MRVRDMAGTMLGVRISGHVVMVMMSVIAMIVRAMFMMVTTWRRVG